MLTPSGHTTRRLAKRERETEADAYRELGLFAGRSTTHFLPLFYVAWRLCERALVCIYASVERPAAALWVFASVRSQSVT